MDKLMAFVKKYQVIIILSVVVAIMTIVKLTYKAPVVEIGANPTPTPAYQLAPTMEPQAINLSPTETLGPVVATMSASDQELYQQYKDVIDAKLPLWQKLPHQGDGYVVEKYTAPLTLLVTYSKGSINQVKNAVQGWMVDQGVGATSHTLEFQRSPDWQ